jgi:hypothetical protein
MANKEKEKQKRIIHKHSLTSFLTTFSFVIVAASGIMMFIVPPGRIASWTEWKFFGLTREEWVSIHIVLSIFFAGIGIYHLILNWRIFTSYIISKISKGLHYARELIISIVIVLFCAFGAYLQIFPFRQFIAFNNWVKTLWVTSPEFEPPIAHAEDLSLVNFATRMGMNLDQAMEELKKNKISVQDVNDSLAIIGDQNHMSPMEIYMKIKKFETPITPSTVFTNETVEQKFEGRGIGEKTLAQVAKENNLDLDAMKKRLSAQGVTLKEGETIRELADRQKIKTVPIQILQMALIDKSATPKEAPKEKTSASAIKETAPTSQPQVAPSPAQPTPPAPQKSATPAAPATQKTPVYTEEMVKAQFEGKGYGEKTLAQVVKENNIDMNYINKRLTAKNLSMKEGETMREMAARYNTTFIELIKMILVENPSVK